jgi:hypothetical protein
MAPNYVADARALVMKVLDDAGALSNIDPRAFEATVAAVARDLEVKDMVEDAAAHRARLDTDSIF